MDKHIQMMLDYDPLCANCQKVANLTGAAAYVVGRPGKQDRVIQSGMFTPIARRACRMGGLSIRWVSWPIGWTYGR